LRGGRQHGIAALVAQGVIHPFEPVQIKVQQGYLSVCRAKTVFQRPLKGAPVRQPCQRVVIGRLFQRLPRLVKFAVSDR
jgi:hypothetical protein